MKVYQKRKYHERRWRTFLEPLVPADGKDRTFLDLGCNAGFYMTKAEKLGYRAIGLERDADYISQAPAGLAITQGDVNYYDPPSAFLTLLACVHYHQTDEQVEALLYKLIHSTAHLLVMGRHKGPTWAGTSSSSMEHLLKIMAGWSVVDSIDTGKFYSVLFTSPKTKEFSVESLYESTKVFVSKIANYDQKFVHGFECFVRGVIDGKANDSLFMEHIHRNRRKYPKGRCWIYRTIIEDIQKHGLRVPLMVKEGRIKDGWHRLIIMRELGIKRVICRVR